VADVLPLVALSGVEVAGGAGVGLVDALLLAPLMPSKADNMLELSVDPPLEAMPESPFVVEVAALNAVLAEVAVFEAVVLTVAAAAQAAW
jgi:hypothetical protein